jgi:hypothetical protein
MSGSARCNEAGTPGPPLASGFALAPESFVLQCKRRGGHQIPGFAVRAVARLLAKPSRQIPHALNLFKFLDAHPAHSHTL